MKLIPLTQGKFVQVDDEDYEWLSQWNWRVIKGNYTWYAVRGLKSIRMHREIMKTPEELVVDHTDWNGLNCQKYNMRNCTSSQNTQNSRDCGKYRGVSWSKKARKFICNIRGDGRFIYLGSFLDECEAALVYNNAALKYYGESARLNIIR